jgi:acetylornithine/succinyldiaminopimelate/putrescine aminotransferase
MKHWQQPDEVVHTSTFAGAPLACAAANKTITVLERDDLVRVARETGDAFVAALNQELAGLNVRVRGRGLMVGVDLPGGPGAAIGVLQSLARLGYLVSTGGGRRETLVVTPPLLIEQRLLDGFVGALGSVLRELTT